MTIRRFTEADAEATTQVVAETVEISNSRDYPPEYITELKRSHSAEVVLEAVYE